MHFNDKIDVSEEEIAQYSKELLNILLKDRTTENNIIWATDDYRIYGQAYRKTEQITSDLITGINARLIQPRVCKENKHKNNRTRQKAEVFTPSWICNSQNNLIDEQWFGRKNVFNIQDGTTWNTIKEKIVFPDDVQHTWQSYIDARRIEVCCGEAPYLVSRYDTVTGQPIDLSNRIGLLDRKLRIVTENTSKEEDWIKWAYRAYESIYGFEYQGDNLLLARENILYTFVDNMKYALERIPTIGELKKIANIISWNIWQMDGLTFYPPLCDVVEDDDQITLFDIMENTNDNTQKAIKSKCKIKDWRSRLTVEYYSLLEGEK